MCTSVDTTGHTFVDDETQKPYRSMAKEMRIWQRCTGCGNVQSRLADENTDTIALADITRGQWFRIDNGDVMVMDSVDASTEGLSTVVRYYTIQDPRKLRKVHLLDVSAFAFYRA